MQIHVLDWIDEVAYEVTHHHKCLYLISIDIFKIICYTTLDVKFIYMFEVKNCLLWLSNPLWINQRWFDHTHTHIYMPLAWDPLWDEKEVEDEEHGLWQALQLDHKHILSKAYFWWVWCRYKPSIEIATTLVWSWDYFRSLKGKLKYW